MGASEFDCVCDALHGDLSARPVGNVSKDRFLLVAVLVTEAVWAVSAVSNA